MTKDKQLAEYILPGLVQRALDGRESAKAAILHGLLEACHTPTGDETRRRVHPLVVLNDYQLDALRTSAVDTYNGTELYTCLFRYESFPILEFVIEDYKQEHGCSEKCSKCSKDLDYCKAPGAASWEPFLPIFELQNLLIDKNIDLWVKRQQIGEHSRAKEKALAVVQKRIESLLSEHNKNTLKAFNDREWYDGFCATFTYLLELTKNALQHTPDRYFFLPKNLASLDTCTSYFFPDVLEELRVLHGASPPIPIEDIRWEKEKLESLVRAMTTNDGPLPLPAHIVLTRILEFKFKE